MQMLRLSDPLAFEKANTESTSRANNKREFDHTNRSYHRLTKVDQTDSSLVTFGIPRTYQTNHRFSLVEPRFVWFFAHAKLFKMEKLVFVFNWPFMDLPNFIACRRRIIGKWNGN